VIGLHDTIETVFPAKNKIGLGSTIVTNGPLYDFVAKVNKELMTLTEESQPFHYPEQNGR
jgi:hypothetical protein